MRARLRFVEIENFKTYGKETFDLLDDFIAIVGPNGSGKSNFMDAVAFALGEGPEKLRVTSFIELVSANALESPFPISASVTATFVHSDETTTSFRRVVNDTGAVQQSINGQPVSRKKYRKRLQALGINMRARNSLVYQGTVEYIALQKPKDRTRWLEDLSGSVNFEEPYKEALFRERMAHSSVTMHFHGKKLWEWTKHMAEKDMQEANAFSNVDALLAKKRLDHSLFRLYHAEKMMNLIQEECELLQEAVAENKENMAKSRGRLQNKRNKRNKVSERIETATEEFRRLDLELKCNVELMANGEAIAHWSGKARSAQEALSEAGAKAAAHEHVITKLNTDLAHFAAKRLQIESTGDYPSDDSPDIALDAERSTYRSLREAAEKRSATEIERFASLSREQNVFRDQLEWERLRLSQVKDKIDLNKADMKHIAAFCFKMQMRIIESTDVLECLNGKLADCLSAKQDSMDTRKELYRVQEELNYARVCQDEVATKTRKMDNMVRLRALFRNRISLDGRFESKPLVATGIGSWLFKDKWLQWPTSIQSHSVQKIDCGRLANEFQPLHRRYTRAINTVMGEYIDAIIVDEESTASRCIDVLREEGLPPEIFLPMKEIPIEDVQFSKRKNCRPPMAGAQHTVYLSRVIKYPEELEGIIQFVTKGTLVCENQKEAEEIASRFNVNVVSWDGILFSQSGLVHGRYIVPRATRQRSSSSGDSDYVSQLEAEEMELMRTLSLLDKTVIREAELQAQIDGVNLRLKLLEVDQKKAVERKRSIEEELRQLQNDLTSIEHRIDGVQTQIRDREAPMRQLQDEIRRAQDEIYFEFCSQIGVEDIREYEEQLGSKKRKSQEIHALTNIMEGITNELDLALTTRSQLNENVWRCKEAVEKCRRQLQQSRHRLEEKKLELVEREALLNNIDKDKWNASNKLNQINKDIDKTEKLIDTAKTKHKKWTLEILEKRNELSRLKEYRLFLLKQCAVKNIEVPLSAGRLAHAFRRKSDDGIEIDYSNLRKEWAALDDENEINSVMEDFENTIATLEMRMESFKTPNTKAAQNMDMAEYNLKRKGDSEKRARRAQREARKSFNSIKAERSQVFNSCFQRIASRIQPIYQLLTGSSFAKALLTCENPEEPYLGKTYLDFVVPGKTWYLFNGVSSGEGAMLSLAFIFAADEYQHSPCYILDEISASVDMENTQKLAAFLRAKSSNTQIIVITHDAKLARHSDLLVGTCEYDSPIYCRLTKYQVDTPGLGIPDEQIAHEHGGHLYASESGNISRDIGGDLRDHDASLDEKGHKYRYAASDSDTTVLVPNVLRHEEKTNASHGSDVDSLNSLAVADRQEDEDVIHDDCDEENSRAMDEGEDVIHDDSDEENSRAMDEGEDVIHDDSDEENSRAMDEGEDVIGDMADGDRGSIRNQHRNEDTSELTDSDLSLDGSKRKFRSIREDVVRDIDDSISNDVTDEEDVVRDMNVSEEQGREEDADVIRDIDDDLDRFRRRSLRGITFSRNL